MFIEQKRVSIISTDNVYLQTLIGAIAQLARAHAWHA